ncbi:MAG: hypothetical protein J3Q66DRAFT_358450 [Benniella sp.]|nr:MAG: hypothetical protein J3Q66DRAFT_358450 [Benniella sp.]
MLVWAGLEFGQVWSLGRIGVWAGGAQCAVLSSICRLSRYTQQCFGYQLSYFVALPIAPIVIVRSQGFLPMRYIHPFSATGPPSPPCMVLR